jgi:Spy/CpxP family protein refolding chaperone
MLKPFLSAIALVGLMLGTPVLASAQNAPAPDASNMPAHSMRHHHPRMRALLSSLDLTADQKTQIKGFMKSYRESRESGTPETREQFLGQIESVLTPDQKSKLESEMHQSRQD